MTRDCTHGQLTRSCNICDLEQEVARLQEMIDAPEVCPLPWYESVLNVRDAELIQRLIDGLPEATDGAAVIKYLEAERDKLIDLEKRSI